MTHAVVVICPWRPDSSEGLPRAERRLFPSIIAGALLAIKLVT